MADIHLKTCLYIAFLFRGVSEVAITECSQGCLAKATLMNLAIHLNKNI